MRWQWLLLWLQHRTASGHLAGLSRWPCSSWIFELTHVAGDQMRCGADTSRQHSDLRGW